MIKRGTIACIVVTSLLSTPVLASPLDNINKNLDLVITEISKAESSVQKINYEVEDVKFDIDETKDEIVLIEEEIVRNQAEISRLEKEIKYQEKQLIERIKSTYMNNTTPTKQCLEVLLNATDIKDFAQRLKTVKEILTLNKAKINSFNLNKMEFENKQKEIIEKKEKLEELVESLDLKLDDLMDKKKEKESTINEYKDLKEKYEKEIYDYEKIIAKAVTSRMAVAEARLDYGEDIRESIDIQNNVLNLDDNIVENEYEIELNDNTDAMFFDEDTTIENNDVYEEESEDSYYEEDNSLVNPPIYSNGSYIVNIAFKYLGVPYVWGGTTPSGFDCSGFAQYVYREAGINISRTTYTQVNEGYAVSNLQSGDLVFFGSYNSPYHVGVYIGDGQYVHAPTEGDVVKVALLKYRDDYCGARRYL